MAKKRKLTLQNIGKLAFSRFVEALKVKSRDQASQAEWLCCDKTYTCLRDVHKHASIQHRAKIDAIRDGLRLELSAQDDPDHKRRRVEMDAVESSLPDCVEEGDVFSWLPSLPVTRDGVSKGQILLFYHYRWIDNTEHVLSWQKELCRRLNLTGKIRIASEGLNGTVGGTMTTTALYIDAVLAHPLFRQMTREDFKRSEGSAKDFPDGLKVAIYKEVCPMGIDPEELPFSEAGRHVTPEEFHRAVESHVCGESRDHTLFVDCRNFYESKIGTFEGAIRPDIRKFSYWPEYVDKNAGLFREKTVYMYCTGGIRCERASAYLKNKGVCKDVLQLSGGIHKYMEKYPDGYFRGKLFVFDNRFHIKANDDVICSCVYCGAPWDSYEPCTSAHCHQLVLSCAGCRANGLTACCRPCQTHAAENQQQREECACTEKRVKVPLETDGANRFGGNVTLSDGNVKGQPEMDINATEVTKGPAD